MKKDEIAMLTKITDETVANWVAGEFYFVGDLGYLHLEEWNYICGNASYNNEDWVITLEDGRKVALFSTCSDGLFTSDSGLEYCVDSGTLGIIKVSDLRASDLVTLREVIEKGNAHIVEMPGFDIDTDTSICGSGFDLGREGFTGEFPCPDELRGEDY
jgi:hypothetical protein